MTPIVFRDWRSSKDAFRIPHPLNSKFTISQISMQNSVPSVELNIQIQMYEMRAWFHRNAFHVYVLNTKVGEFSTLISLLRYVLRKDFQCKVVYNNDNPVIRNMTRVYTLNTKKPVSIFNTVRYSWIHYKGILIIIIVLI